MRIESSIVGMESARSYKASRTAVSRFVIMDYQESLQQTDMTLSNENGNGNGDGNESGTGVSGLSTQEGQSTGTLTGANWQDYFGMSTTRLKLSRENTDIAENIRQITVRYIFELLFGRRSDRLQELTQERGLAENSAGQTSDQTQNNLNGMGIRVSGLSLLQETHYYEEESTTFSTTGSVVTADGRKISFDVNVGMSRRFEQTFLGKLDFSVQSTIDPLVINLDTDVATLRDQSFFFDLDSDGQAEEISMLDAASGYLAMDWNEDGVINDGSELFGTRSGDGFAELAQYDEDGDGWIDEDDEIWSKLQIWCKDANGQDRLYRLADKGVGAICLNSAATEFSQKDVQGNLQGVIRSTGIFLYENGNVGTVQHLDLAT